MPAKSRLGLEVEGRVAFLVMIAAMFPTIFAQRREVLSLQTLGTCIMLAGGVIGLRAGIQLKKCREPTSPLVQRLRWTSALAYVLIMICGFGAFAVLGNTRRGWTIWAAISLFLIAVLACQPREKV